VLVLLPPSEGKAGSGRGRPLDLAALSLPGLTPAREQVLSALVGLCSTAGDAADDEQADDEQAGAILGLSPGQRGEVARNARLREAAALPAGKLYTGVLYDALDLTTLHRPAHRLAQRSILVFSGLWGAVRLTDRIPPYRCSISCTLPGVGGLGAYWRKAMATVMAEAAGDGPILDLRSGAYATMWRPAGAVAARTAAVRVLHERVVRGVTTRSVVSHFNKATKGRLVRSLLESGGRPRTRAELVTALRDLKYTVEEHATGIGLDVVVTEL
jgi:cytoplasmic iron level regulating protein YaaA (DUF328/UPF0246 family)